MESQLRLKLRTVVEDTDTLAGKVFDVAIILLVIASLFTLTIGTLPDLDPFWEDIFWILDVSFIAIFTIEYGLRIYATKHRMKYIQSFWGIVDFAAISPFYLTLLLGTVGFDARALRILRLFRVVRLIKIPQIQRALINLKIAFKEIKTELYMYLSLMLMITYISSVGIYYFEHSVQPEKFSSIIDSMWWSIITLTTVGYGDYYPITLGGRIFAGAILILSLGIVAAPAGLIASGLTRSRQLDNQST